MIGHQGPCITENIQPGAYPSQPIQEIISVEIILKYSFSLYTSYSYYYVMECPGYILMILFFMSFLSIRLEAVWGALHQASLSILSLVALKMVILPVILYGLFLYVMPEYAVAALLLTAVSTGVVAPFMSNLVGGNSARVLVVTVITSILVPFSLPAVVGFVLSTSVDLSFWDMLRVLALAIFVPIAVVQILRRYAPQLLDAANRRAYPVNLGMFALINLGVFSKYAEIFHSDPHMIAEAALVGKVPVIIEGGNVSIGYGGS